MVHIKAIHKKHASHSFIVAKKDRAVARALKRTKVLFHGIHIFYHKPSAFVRQNSLENSTFVGLDTLNGNPQYQKIYRSLPDLVDFPLIFQFLVCPEADTTKLTNGTHCYPQYTPRELSNNSVPTPQTRVSRISSTRRTNSSRVGRRRSNSSNARIISSLCSSSAESER